MPTTQTRPDAVPSAPPAFPGAVDPRGQRFAAAVTVAVLAAVLLAPGAYGAWLLALQVGVFAAGAIGGPAATPYGWLFRTLVRPRLGPPQEWEAPEPPRFAQGVGLVFAAAGLVALLSGLTVLGQVAVGAALLAASLNATIGLCLGCEVYLLSRRALARTISPPPDHAA